MRVELALDECVKVLAREIAALQELRTLALVAKTVERVTRRVLAERNVLFGLLRPCGHSSPQLIYLLADVFLRRPGRGLQPVVVDLRQDAVFTRHPAVAEILQGGGFLR